MTAPRFELTSQRQKVSRLVTEPRGRPAIEELLLPPSLRPRKTQRINYTTLRSRCFLQSVPIGGMFSSASTQSEACLLFCNSAGDGMVWGVNTVVGLFWIMLKISTWLVVFFVPPEKPFYPLYLHSQSASSLLKLYQVYAIYCIYLIGTL